MNKDATQPKACAGSFVTIFAIAGCAGLQATADAAALQFAGAPCTSPPALHCPDRDCPVQTVIDGGPVVEPRTGRQYFLDYPCDLRPGEPVNVILSLHGGGSFGNWQRHYFPIMDYVDKYRLVIATPNTRAWSPQDDEYLQNIVSTIIDQLGRENVRSFWLAGHSMGSFNSRRLVCTDFFKDKVDGYLSLSGGRVGSPPSEGPARFDIPRQNDGVATNASRTRPPGPPPGASGPGGSRSVFVTGQGTLDCDFSHIYAGGEHEPSAQSLPTTSTWAEKYHCEARQVTRQVVDTRPGYVYDSSRQQYGTDAWGRQPRPGTAKIMQYPHCDGGRIVADVIRFDKGHTEGLEPHITEELVKMMIGVKAGNLSDEVTGVAE